MFIEKKIRLDIQYIAGNQQKTTFNSSGEIHPAQGLPVSANED